SEQYQPTNSPMAWSYVRWPLTDVRLFSTAALACSRSGKARTRFGAFFLLRDFVLGIDDGLPDRRRHPYPLLIPAALHRRLIVCAGSVDFHCSAGAPAPACFSSTDALDLRV